MRSQPRQFVAEPRETFRSSPDTTGASSAGELLSILTREEPTRTWVTPVGELDLATGATFDQCLRDAQARCRSLVLDLRALTFIDCAGLRAVLDARRRAAEHGHGLEVLCGPGQVGRLLSITGGDRLLDVLGPPPPAPVRDEPAVRTAA